MPVGWAEVPTETASQLTASSPQSFSFPGLPQQLTSRAPPIKPLHASLHLRFYFPRNPNPDTAFLLRFHLREITCDNIAQAPWLQAADQDKPVGNTDRD